MIAAMIGSPGYKVLGIITKNTENCNGKGGGISQDFASDSCSESAWCRLFLNCFVPGDFLGGALWVQAAEPPRVCVMVSHDTRRREEGNLN